MEMVAESLGVLYCTAVRQRRCDIVPVISDEVKAGIMKAARLLCGESNKWGLMVMGRLGNGKTTLVRAMRMLVAAAMMDEEESHRIVRIELEVRSARDIAALRVSDSEEFRRLCGVRLLAIDDLGEEPVDVRDYGNRWLPMVELLSYRYDRRLVTVVTTNLKNDEVRGNYGDRIADRLNEMMEVAIFRGDSYRGKEAEL